MLLLAFIAVILSGYSEPHKSDFEALQGKWEGTDKNSTPAGPYFITFSGKTLDFHGPDTNDWIKATFTLRENTQPKQLVGVVKECPASEVVGSTAFAIYKLEGDTLTLCSFGPGETNIPATFGIEGAKQLVFKKK